jgi:hypothetical protein
MVMMLVSDIGFPQCVMSCHYMVSCHAIPCHAVLCCVLHADAVLHNFSMLWTLTVVIKLVSYFLTVSSSLSCPVIPCCAETNRAVLCCALQADAVPGIILMLWTLTVVMKLVSYAHCHADLRTAHRRSNLRPGERGASGAVLRHRMCA